MEDAVAVGVAERLGHLADDAEAGVEVDLGRGVEQPPVEGPGVGVVLEEQARAALVLEVVNRGEDAGVLEGVQVPELPLRGAGGCLPLFGGGVLLERVEAQAPAHAGQPLVLDQKVLVGDARVRVGVHIGQKLDDAIVAEALPADPL